MRAKICAREKGRTRRLQCGIIFGRTYELILLLPDVVGAGVMSVFLEGKLDEGTMERTRS